MAVVHFVHYKQQSQAMLKRAAAYICRDNKTEQGKWISGQNCAPLFAVEEFRTTRELHRKTSPVWFYHYTQSFSPKDPVTPAQAHEMAKEFAAKAWPGCEVLIATHVDRDYLHSHFIVNAVRPDTGMMLRQGPKTLERLRKISDEMCLAHGLSVLTGSRPKVSKGMSTREYRAAEKGESWKLRLMFVIDDCMKRSRSRREYEEELRRRGYEVRWTEERQYITYTTPTGKKCRDIRLHGDKYLKEAMEREFRIREQTFFGRIKTDEPTAGAVGPEYAASASHRTGMAGAAGRGGEDFVMGAGDAAAGAGTDQRPGAGGPESDGYAPDERAGLRFDPAAAGPSDDAATGWEPEREELIAAYFGGGALEVHKEASADHPDCGGHDDGPVWAAVGLVHRLEDLQDAPPVKDATTQRQRKEHKQWAKEQRKKNALGHREDDNSGMDWEMRM